jgi:hypothetical protein
MVADAGRRGLTIAGLRQFLAEADEAADLACVSIEEQVPVVVTCRGRVSWAWVGITRRERAGRLRFPRLLELE